MAEDLINPRPAIFESVGKGAGGVTSGEGQPRQVGAGPKPVKQGGYYGGLAPASSRLDDGGGDDFDSDDGDGLSTTGARAIPTSPEIVAWGESASAGKSRSANYGTSM